MTGALALHAALLFATGPLQGGADLAPQLRLVQLMGDEPALRTVYAPAYHVLGSLLAPWLGLSGAARVMALAGVAALIFGFRSFQRAAGLPAECSALFAWAPYGFALSWCLPKVEAAGYGLAFFGLALLLRRRHALLAVALAATFAVHTAAALLLGLCGGLLALQRRDVRALAALAAGCVLASPLLAAHLRAGCSFAEALLFSQGDYLRRTSGWSSAAHWERILMLAGPIGVACAIAGATRLWQQHRSIALLSVLLVVLYLNELWLEPFGARSTLNLMRGLTVFAVPVALSAGVAVAGDRRRATAVTTACAVWALLAIWLALPGSCHRVPVDLERVASLELDRCSFRWFVREARPSPAPGG